jgi:PilZ domain
MGILLECSILNRRTFLGRLHPCDYGRVFTTGARGGDNYARHEYLLQKADLTFRSHSARVGTGVGEKMEKRLPVSIVVNLVPAVCIPAAEAELTYTDNVSDHGACVVSNRPWQLGEVAEVTSLLDQIPLLGKVAHCRKCGDDRYAIGLKFQNAVHWPAYLRYAVQQARRPGVRSRACRASK